MTQQPKADPFGYFARKAQLEADIRASAPYIVDGERRVETYEALVASLEAVGLCVDPKRNLAGSFHIFDPASGYLCGHVEGGQA